PGMLIEALKKYGAAAKDTPFIGDAVTDLQAAHAANCQRYLVMTGKGRETSQTLPDALKPVTLCDDLLAAARKITTQT
ncbi:MAG: HAD hydrolase-like protein, partial [Candidatus Sungbacteria bacterium]|nr:HAD hydrolase-like protein [Candidatus Sungbacteria bacterium]